MSAHTFRHSFDVFFRKRNQSAVVVYITYFYEKKKFTTFSRLTYYSRSLSLFSKRDYRVTGFEGIEVDWIRKVAFCLDWKWVSCGLGEEYEISSQS